MSGHIYVIMFTNGITKVGMTSSPGDRLGQITHAAKAVGVSTYAIFISTIIDDPQSAEIKLIDDMKNMSERTSTEYFTDLDELDVELLLKKHDIPTFRMVSVGVKTVNGVKCWQGVFDMPDQRMVGTPCINNSDLSDKVVDLITRCGDLTIGILNNRLRGYKKNVVRDVVDDLVDIGAIFREEYKHPKNGRNVLKYSLNNMLTPTKQ